MVRTLRMDSPSEGGIFIFWAEAEKKIHKTAEEDTTESRQTFAILQVDLIYTDIIKCQRAEVKDLSDIYSHLDQEGNRNLSS